MHHNFHDVLDNRPLFIENLFLLRWHTVHLNSLSITNLGPFSAKCPIFRRVWRIHQRTKNHPNGLHLANLLQSSIFLCLNWWNSSFDWYDIQHLPRNHNLLWHLCLCDNLPGLMLPSTSSEPTLVWRYSRRQERFDWLCNFLGFGMVCYRLCLWLNWYQRLFFGKW